jgi:hypothetical protein
MTHIAGLERDQLLLLPEAVDDYVGSDNPVRFIDAFVDGLDLTAAGFLRVEAKAMGRPGYAPSDLLKLYIYGYLNRVRYRAAHGVDHAAELGDEPVARALDDAPVMRSDRGIGEIATEAPQAR